MLHLVFQGKLVIKLKKNFLTADLKRKLLWDIPLIDNKSATVHHARGLAFVQGDAQLHHKSGVSFRESGRFGMIALQQRLKKMNK